MLFNMQICMCIHILLPNNIDNIQNHLLLVKKYVLSALSHKELTKAQYHILRKLTPSCSQSYEIGF